MAGLLLAGGVFTANAQKDSKDMPRSAAFVGRDVVELGQIGTGSDTYKSNGFYQLSFSKGDSVLAMLWDPTKGTSGMYRLMVRELKKANTPLDNTLWSISASWDKTSGTINYVFVNKATLLPLQIAVPQGTTAEDALIQGAITNWVWNPNVKALTTNPIKATVSSSESAYLTLKSDTVQVLKQASGLAAPSNLLQVKPVEAGRVILTADQINSKLTNVTGEEGTHVDFIFDPEVKNPVPEDAKNILTEMTWVAKGWSWTLEADSTLKKGVGFEVPNFKSFTAPDTIVADSTLIQFVSYLDLKKASAKESRVLMVDTAYFDDAMNNKYNLKLAAKKLTKNEDTYKLGAAGAAVALDTIATGKKPVAYAAFQDQSLFKVIYEPSYDRVLLQAKQTSFIAKDSLAKKQAWAYQKQAADSLKYDGFVVAHKLDTATLHTDTVAFNPIRSNMVKLVYLTPGHSELTVDVPDSIDVKAGLKGYSGALTTIKMEGTKNFGQWTYANISTGFYYIQNAKEKSTALIPANGWAYMDLTATNYSNNGNVVYSAEKFETMPSAQWYISGNAGYFTITNRESAKEWSTQYWYAVKDAAGNDIPNVYTNYGTFGNSGIANGDKDTLRLVQVPNNILKEKLYGYLNISQDVAKADTSVFTFKYVTPLEVNLGLTMGSDSVLVMKDGEAMNFKLERVSKDNGEYGFDDEKLDRLERAAYYIYADEVSSNSTEITGYHNRKYVVLEGGKYRLMNIIVKDNADGTTSLVNPDKDADGKDTNFVNGFSRGQFFVKEIGESAKNYVLVDPRDQNLPTTAQGNIAKGVRMAMDQTTLTMRANALPSVAENVYTNSLLNIVKAAAGNYVSDLAYGDTVKVFSNDYPEVVMYENEGLLAMSSLEAGRTYNTAMFVDTANVRNNTAKPQYMFVLRPEFDPNCNFPNHAHHAVEGDYLMCLTDSAAVDAKYTWENRKFARLGFIPARHEGDILTVKSTGNEINLSDNSKDQYCTFALRYVDTTRDAFYLETLMKKGTPADKHNNEVPDQKGWVRWHNGVPVVVSDLSQAGKFNFEATSDSPVANETIGTSTISVVATNGGVIVKGAEGKKVVISNVLGQTIANTVITSSETTIATPAGVVYVKVDGEAAVPAIVK